MSFKSAGEGAVDKKRSPLNQLLFSEYKGKGKNNYKYLKCESQRENFTLPINTY